MIVNKRFLLMAGVCLSLAGTAAAKTEKTVFASEKESTLQAEEGTISYISTSIEYELEGRQEPPEYAILTLDHEASGENNEVRLPRVEVTEKYQEWKDGFSFPIIISGYDSDVFLIDGTEIPADSDLTYYGDVFLKYLGLSSEYYKIDEIQWAGEAYMKDGILCRNAAARGEKLIRHADVKYGGEVRLQTEEKTEKQKENAEKTEIEETVKETAEDSVLSEETEITNENIVQTEKQPESFFEQAVRWFKEHLTVISISVWSLIGVILFGIVYRRSYAKKKRRV